MRDSATIIENKKTDANTNKQKQLEWVNVQRKFCELSGKRREVDQLKGAWRRLRITVNKRVGDHKNGIKTTSGGHYFMLSQKASITRTNNDVEEKSLKLLEEEYALKRKYQVKELRHQKLRHKLEIEILMMETEIKKKMLEKKDLDIHLLKSKIS